MTNVPHEAEHLEDLLRKANPVFDEELPLPAESPAAQHLYERISGTPYAGRPSRRGGSAGRRRIIPVIAALVTAGGLGGVASYAFTNQTVSRHFAVSCYSSPSLDAEAVAVDARAEGPIATCAQAWSEGHVGSGPVPLLAACVTPQGVAAVFPSAPGADVCAQLGLPALPAGADTLPKGTSTTAPPTTLTAEGMPATVRDAIIGDLRGTCMTATQAQITITALLAKAKVTWKVSVPSPFPVGHPCASPGFDETDRLVILTGIPSTGGG